MHNAEPKFTFALATLNLMWLLVGCWDSLTPHNTSTLHW